MARARVTINRRGVKELLHDPAIVKELHRQAEKVAAAAGPDVYIVDDLSGGYRARSEVHDVAPGAMEREAKTGRLVRALDAAG